MMTVPTLVLFLAFLLLAGTREAQVASPAQRFETHSLHAASQVHISACAFN